MNTLSNEELYSSFLESSSVKGSVSKGEKYFKQIYENLSPQIFSYILRFTKNREAAEDILQETFYRLFYYGKSFNKTKSLKPYLYRIATNLCKDSFRKSNKGTNDTLSEKNEFLAENVFSHYPSPENDLENSELQNYLTAFIDHLPEKIKIAVILRFDAGLTFPEISKTLHIPERTIKWRVNKGLRELKVSLEKKGYRGV